MLDRVLLNWPLKLLAASLAFAIWVFVSGEERIVRDFEIPLDMQLPEHLALLEAPPTTVAVRLRGPEGLIRRIQPGDMAIGVELGDTPTNRLDSDWRQRMEDMIWTLMNSPEFVFLP